jgi:L-ribulokinase
MNTKYTTGVNFGTLSGRTVIVNVTEGWELATAVHEYGDNVK